MKRGFALIIGAILAGCASAQGPAFAPKKSLLGSVIYVYRPDNTVLITYPLEGVVNVPMLVVCGNDSASLDPGGYHAFTVGPGVTSCSSLSAESSAVLRISAEEGKSYFVKGSLGPGFYAPHPQLKLVSTDAAPTGIQQCALE
ncbi:MAG TPA: hypothetical protein VFB15_13740 [Candidatus Binataceae bacterium]|nr:hypothetical protein [Candidatus Binataceae bacterium]